MINFNKFENLVGSGKVVGSLVTATNSHLTHFPVGQIGIRAYIVSFSLVGKLELDDIHYFETYTSMEPTCPVVTA